LILLEAKDLIKNYWDATGKLEVIKNLNLQVGAGEFVAITGESGSGKSTLLHLLGMLDSCDEGEIFYENRKINISDRNINKFRNKEIGFVFQFHYLLDDFTAEENVAMPMFVSTGNYNNSINKAKSLLKQVTLLDRKDHYPNQLSGGEQQRVAVARALINDPKIVLADEPTGNLDEKHSDELIELLLELNKDNDQTFLIVTHNLKVAGQSSNHYILKNGNVQEVIKKPGK